MVNPCGLVEIFALASADVAGVPDVLPVAVMLTY